jgi:FAD synthase
VLIAAAAYFIVKNMVNKGVYAAAGLDTERAIAQVRTNEHYKAQMRSSSAHLMDFLAQSGLLTRPAMSLYKRVNML